MHPTEIVYASPKHFASFHKALARVASEHIYIEMIAPPPLEKVSEFQSSLIKSGGSAFYVIAQDEVIGWCDVFPESNPRMNHRGSLGMGILPEFRGKGLGSQLLQTTLDHAATTSIEKVELNVYTSNTSAIALYRKFGFKEEGLVRDFRRINGKTFDCLLMAKFLGE